MIDVNNQVKIIFSTLWDKVLKDSFKWCKEQLIQVSSQKLTINQLSCRIKNEYFFFPPQENYRKTENNVLK